MIEKIKLKNFTVFDEIEVNFSPKINIIIGENGTGKTHLLKAAYALCSINKALKNKQQGFFSDEDDEYGIGRVLTSKFLNLFLPLDEKLGKMHHTGASNNASLEAILESDRKIKLSFHNNSGSMKLQENSNCQNYSKEPVFIPTKEVLSFMKGFTSLYEKYGLSFDQTYQDICLLLDLPEIRPEKLQEKSKWAMEKIENICGGRFIFHGSGKVTFKNDAAEYSANAMAEGFRKAGMLSRLLETGAIQPGISGPLFWDEPETNMHPKLLQTLVEILLELSRNGQQIIIATHDYILLKCFDLLVDKKGKDDHVLFHSLFRDNVSKKIKIESVDNYLEINENAISEAYVKLTDFRLAKSKGEIN